MVVVPAPNMLGRKGFGVSCIGNDHPSDNEPDIGDCVHRLSEPEIPWFVSSRPFTVTISRDKIVFEAVGSRFSNFIDFAAN